MSGKDFKIWGVSYGISGDLIMALPVLTYFEKKYPDSYKIWAIQKKCGQCAPFFINHPLIDQIYVCEGWDEFTLKDLSIANSCDFKTVTLNWKHSRPDWYNHTNCIEETALIAGITDLKDVLTEDEMIPKLERYFPVGEFNKKNSVYSKSYDGSHIPINKTIGVWQSSATPGLRNPSAIWWKGMIKILIDMGYTIYNFGYQDDSVYPDNYINYTHLSFFEQVKIALSTNMCIGTDSGNMWVMNAYGHKCINLITNWLPNHTSNPLALAPVGKNASNIWTEGGTSYTKYKAVVTEVNNHENVCTDM